SGEDEVGGDLDSPIAFFDDPTGDGLRHLRGEEGPDEVEDRGESDRRFGFDRSRGDRSGHGIGCIVKAIGEVEEQCQCYDKHDDEDDCHYSTFSVYTIRTVDDSTGGQRSLSRRSLPPSSADLPPLFDHTPPRSPDVHFLHAKSDPIVWPDARTVT